MADSSRYSLSFDPNCPTCGEPSEHLSGIGVWICPFCGRCAIEYTEVPEGEVLDFLPGGDPVEVIKILGEFSSHDGLKSMLGTPFESKDDLLDLSRESTSRRWNPERKAWTVDADSIQEVKEHLREAGWPVIDLVRLRRERRQEGD